MNAIGALTVRAARGDSPDPRLPPHPALRQPEPPARWALFVDIDGCLVEFADDPQRVTIHPELVRLLADLRAALDGALALVSGRSLEQIDRMFAPHRFCAAGQHGFERRAADGRGHGAPTPPAAAIERVHREARALQERMPALLLEDKGASVALHYRTAPELGASVASTLDAIAASAGEAYEAQAGARVCELKPVACSKGTAVRAFCAEAPFAGRFPVFLGDEVSDDSAFIAVERAGGIGVCVGSPESSAARHALPTPSAARAWLAQVLQECSAGAPRA